MNNRHGLRMKQAYLLLMCLLFVVLSPHTDAAEDMTDCMAGWNAQKAGDYERSIVLTSRCIADGELRRETLPRAWRNLGIALRSAGHAHKAIEAYQIAISYGPDDVWNDYVNMGNAYSDLGQFDKAFEAYAAAEKHATNPGEVHYNRGIAFERMNKREDAKKAFLLAFDSGLRSEHLAERIIAHGLYERVVDSW